MKETLVYELITIGERVLMLLHEDDSFYISKHFFNGKPLSAGWRSPKVSVFRKSYRLNDFVIYKPHVPVFSQRAKDALEPLISPYVEIRPLIEIKKRPYFLLKILHVVDCLDMSRSELTESPDRPGHYIHAGRLFFDVNKIPDAPIFTVPQQRLPFVRRAFIETVLQHKLTGVGFSDPTDQPSFKTSGNVVPEIEEYQTVDWLRE